MTKKKTRQPKKKFLEYAHTEAGRMRLLNRLGTARNYDCAANRFADYLKTLGKDDVYFNELKPQLMQDFEDWLKKEGVGHNTSSAYLRCLHAIFMRAAIAPLASGDPFAGTYRGMAKTAKRAVTPEDMRLIASFNIRLAVRCQRHADGMTTFGKQFEQKVKKLTFARDLYLFCFCARGMTFVDVAYLRKSDICGGFISYCRHKTGQRIMVKIEEDMQAIIDRYPSSTPYLFPILPANADEQTTYACYINASAYNNQALRELGILLGLKLTSYVARHSWATIAYHGGMALSEVSQAMGHDNQRTTEIYLKSLTSTQIDQANHSLLQTLFHSKKAIRFI